MKDDRLRLFKRCPVTGKVARLHRPEELSLLLLPAIGLAALVWYLVRVIPKPSRAAYPCQRVAAPLASGFLVWLSGIAAASVALRHAQNRLRRSRYLTAVLALIVAAVSLGWTILAQSGPVLAVPVAYTPHLANSPIGTAKGLSPGRVVWTHDPEVTDWDGTSTSQGQRWYDRIDQGRATSLMEWALEGYADAGTADAAWDAIFRSFNGGEPYRAGEKLFIKVNLTTSSAEGCADANYDWTPSGCGASCTSIGQSPQLMYALLNSWLTWRVSTHPISPSATQPVCG